MISPYSGGKLAKILIVKNLGLLEMVVPVGAILAYSAEKAPNGWLKCNGDVFDKTVYPLLAKLHPSGRTPDLRGEFIRGWDDGRGVDSGRILLGAQGDAIRNITGFVSGVGLVFDGFSGAFYDPGSRDAPTPASVNKVNYSDDFSFDASRVVPTANENRPRNIAFNYIVRAA